MKREWVPGDVALATRLDGTSRRAILRADLCWRIADECVNNPPIDFRPLIVIDPEDHEQVGRLAEAIRSTEAHDGTMTSLAAALRSLIEPSKPEEPTGLGAVVEDADGVRWIRTHDSLAPWLRQNFTTSRYFTGIDVVKVLSEGVQP